MIAWYSRNVPDQELEDETGWCYFRGILATKCAHWGVCGWGQWLGSEVASLHLRAETIRFHESWSLTSCLSSGHASLSPFVKWGRGTPVVSWSPFPAFTFFILCSLLGGSDTQSHIHTMTVSWIAAFKVKILFSGKESSLFFQKARSVQTSTPQNKCLCKACAISGRHLG